MTQTGGAAPQLRALEQQLSGGDCQSPPPPLCNVLHGWGLLPHTGAWHTGPSLAAEEDSLQAHGFWFRAFDNTVNGRLGGVTHWKWFPGGAGGTAGVGPWLHMEMLVPSKRGAQVPLPVL